MAKFGSSVYIGGRKVGSNINRTRTQKLNKQIRKSRARINKRFGFTNPRASVQPLGSRLTGKRNLKSRKRTSKKQMVSNSKQNMVRKIVTNVKTGLRPLVQNGGGK